MSEGGLALNAENLARVARTRLDGLAVEVPDYPCQPDKLICHLGPGRFHRAHQAHFLHRLLQRGLAQGWGICGIGLRAADRPLLRALQAQDGLYSLLETDGAGRKLRVIGSIMQLLDASEDSGPALELLASTATRIISLTITEAGYCLDTRGELDLSHPDVAHDLALAGGAGTLRSAAGLLVRALALRRERDLPGCTLLSCDNLIDNGRQLQRSVLGFAQRFDASLAYWIDQQVSFPSSMVDRITPAANPAQDAELCAHWGVHDQAPVLCESWLQWIIEDHFVAGRPPFEQAGAVMSAQVPTYEKMKVGLLNGGHSAISHLGLMLGYTRVHEALGDALLRDWLAGYMGEVAQTLQPIAGVDYAAYQASLILRFSNPAIEDRLLRLAQDTSGKYVQSLLPPLKQRLAAGLPVEHFACAIALWMLFLSTDSPAREACQDPRKTELMALTVAADFVAAVLPLEQAAGFSATVQRHLQGLRTAGTRAYMSQLSFSCRESVCPGAT